MSLLHLFLLRLADIVSLATTMLQAFPTRCCARIFFALLMSLDFPDKRAICALALCSVLRERDPCLRYMATLPRSFLVGDSLSGCSLQVDGASGDVMLSITDVTSVVK